MSRSKNCDRVVLIVARLVRTLTIFTCFPPGLSSSHGESSSGESKIEVLRDGSGDVVVSSCITRNLRVWPSGSAAQPKLTGKTPRLPAALSTLALPLTDRRSTHKEIIAPVVKQPRQKARTATKGTSMG